MRKEPIKTTVLKAILEQQLDHLNAFYDTNPEHFHKVCREAESEGYPFLAFALACDRSDAARFFIDKKIGLDAPLLNLKYNENDYAQNSPPIEIGQAFVDLFTSAIGERYSDCAPILISADRLHIFEFKELLAAGADYSSPIKSGKFKGLTPAALIIKNIHGQKTNRIRLAYLKFFELLIENGVNYHFKITENSQSAFDIINEIEELTTENNPIYLKEKFFEIIRREECFLTEILQFMKSLFSEKMVLHFLENHPQVMLSIRPKNRGGSGLEQLLLVRIFLADCGLASKLDEKESTISLNRSELRKFRGQEEKVRNQWLEFCKNSTKKKSKKLKKKSTPAITPLQAVLNKDVKALEALFASDPKSCLRESLEEGQYFGWTPLGAAVAENCLDSVAFFIDQQDSTKCHFSLDDPVVFTGPLKGLSPIFLAIEKGHLAILEKLDRGGADLCKTSSSPNKFTDLAPLSAVIQSINEKKTLAERMKQARLFEFLVKLGLDYQSEVAGQFLIERILDIKPLENETEVCIIPVLQKIIEEQERECLDIKILMLTIFGNLKHIQLEIEWIANQGFLWLTLQAVKQDHETSLKLRILRDFLYGNGISASINLNKAQIRIAKSDLTDVEKLDPKLKLSIEKFYLKKSPEIWLERLHTILPNDIATQMRIEGNSILFTFTPRVEALLSDLISELNIIKFHDPEQSAQFCFFTENFEKEQTHVDFDNLKKSIEIKQKKLERFLALARRCEGEKRNTKEGYRIVFKNETGKNNFRQLLCPPLLNIHNTNGIYTFKIICEIFEDIFCIMENDLEKLEKTALIEKENQKKLTLFTEKLKFLITVSKEENESITLHASYIHLAIIRKLAALFGLKIESDPHFQKISKGEILKLEEKDFITLESTAKKYQSLLSLLIGILRKVHKQAKNSPLAHLGLTLPKNNPYIPLFQAYIAPCLESFPEDPTIFLIPYHKIFDANVKTLEALNSSLNEALKTEPVNQSKLNNNNKPSEIPSKSSSNEEDNSSNNKDDLPKEKLNPSPSKKSLSLPPKNLISEDLKKNLLSKREKRRALFEKNLPKLPPEPSLKPEIMTAIIEKTKESTEDYTNPILVCKKSNPTKKNEETIASPNQGAESEDLEYAQEIYPPKNEIICFLLLELASYSTINKEERKQHKETIRMCIQFLNAIKSEERKKECYSVQNLLSCCDFFEKTPIIEIEQMTQEAHTFVEKCGELIEQINKSHSENGKSSDNNMRNRNPN